MCGICLLVVKGTVETNHELSAASLASLCNRGPDLCHNESLANEHSRMYCTSSVLHMRSSQTVKQPIHSPNSDNFLLFNGEVYEGLELSDDTNDGVALLGRLDDCHSTNELLRLIPTLHGEFCFVYYSQHQNALWISKDMVGRKSLLMCRDSDKTVIASIQVQYDNLSLANSSWYEIPPGFLWQLSLSDGQLTPFRMSADYDASICKSLTDIAPIESKLSEHNSLLQVLPFNEPAEYSEQAMHDYTSQVLNTLRTAVHRRMCCDHTPQPNEAKHVAVLFSGGLDSTVLAWLVHEVSQEAVVIDLVTVAFAKTDADKEAFAATADRQTAVTAYNVLRTNAPARCWQMVCVDVSLQQLQHHRQHTIHRLIAPLTSVLDDSIGCALWFGARAKGTLWHTGNEYTSSARVLILGQGADELFAGYSRHRGKFEMGGWSLLQAEMQMDLGRLWTRNLGRDDRVLSDHGREARFPYLDEHFLRLVNSLPLDVKCDLWQRRGVGEKSLLRSVAVRLGLTEVAFVPKRAIQFGSRIAKIECRKEKGGDQCSRLTNKL